MKSGDSSAKTEIAIESKFAFFEFSLFIGIVIGGAFYALDAASGFSGFMGHVFNDGLIASAATYIFAGFVKNPVLSLVFGTELLAGTLALVRKLAISKSGEIG